MATTYRARRIATGFEIFIDAMKVPTLTLVVRGGVCEVVFPWADSEEAEYVPATFDVATPLADVLARIREGLDAYEKRCVDESEAEAASQRAFYNHLEHDPQADAFRDYEDSLGIIQFEDAYQAACPH